MWQRLSPAWRWGLVVAAAALLLVAIDIWWVMTYREGYPFDIDEAGYTSFGLVDYLGLKYEGIGGWWDSIQGQPKFAPLVPALTSILVYIHPGQMNGFFVLAGFIVVLSLAAYGIGQRLAGPRLGALAAVVTATLPGTFAFAHEYVYALPTAAFLSCAVYALLRSEALRSWGWSVACGAALGLMLLSRTMAIVFVPGVLAAGALAAASRQEGDLGRRAANLALLVLTGVAVAATWYAKNLQSVIDYLTDYGYGNQAQYYGAESSLISLERFRAVGETMVSEDFFLPLALVMLTAMVALAVVVVRELRPPQARRAGLLRLARSDALGVALVVAIGYAGLMSSQNGGNGFTLPLAALVPPLAVVALRRFPRATAPAIAAVAAIALFNLVSTSTIWSTASKTRLVSIPGFEEEFPLTKGQPKALFTIREQVAGPETVFDQGDAEWVRSSEQVMEMLAALYGPEGEAPVVAFASSNRVLSSNAVQLASLLKYQRGMPVMQLEAEPDDSVATYLDQLSDPAFGGATAMISIVPGTADYPPPVTQSKAAVAARRAGLEPSQELTLPDGRVLTLWVEPPAAP